MKYPTIPFHAPITPPPVNGSAPLLASLALTFGHDGSATRLLRRAHTGPLLVQKPLYPEGQACCHAVIVHPPGGVVGGDQLVIQVQAEERAHSLLSTPGAAKWYRANGRVASQQVHIRVRAGATVEWLPQETILFNQAEVDFSTCIELDEGACYLGLEILCFGRTACGERFDQGRVHQRNSVRLNGKLLWIEQGHLMGGSDAMNSPRGLNGYTVCASLMFAGTTAARGTVDAVRASCAPVMGAQGTFGATQMKSMLLVRYLGNSSEVARRIMLAAWRVLRPSLLGREATELRIWNT